jgi:hypothetical protein
VELLQAIVRLCLSKVLFWKYSTIKNCCEWFSWCFSHIIRWISCSKIICPHHDASIFRK